MAILKQGHWRLLGQVYKTGIQSPIAGQCGTQGNP